MSGECVTLPGLLQLTVTTKLTYTYCYRYDDIPEVWQGHNIADFVDPDIVQKLEELEKVRILCLEQKLWFLGLRSLLRDFYYTSLITTSCQMHLTH